MAGPPRRGHPAACLARANRIGPAAPAGGRNAARPCRPLVLLRSAGRPAAKVQPDARHGIIRPRSPKGAAGPKPTDRPIRHAAGRPKGGMGAGVAARRLARRIRQPWTGSRDGNRARAAAPAGMPKGARRAESKAARRRGVTPNEPAGLRSGQRQRRAGNQIPCPVDFIAFNGTRHGYFCLMCLLKL